MACVEQELISAIRLAVLAMGALGRQRCSRDRKRSRNSAGLDEDEPAAGSAGSMPVIVGRGSVVRQRHLPLATLDQLKRQTPLEDLGRPIPALFFAKRAQDRESIVRDGLDTCCDVAVTAFALNHESQTGGCAMEGHAQSIGEQ